MIQNSKEIMNVLPVGIVIIDKNDNIIYANQKASEITGFGISEIDSIDDWYREIFPNKNQRKIAKDNFKKVIDNDKHNRIFRINTKNGQSKHITVEFEKYKNGELLISLMDISEKIENQKELRDQKILFEKLFSHSLLAIAFLNTDFKVLKINSRFKSIFGYSEEEIIDKKINDFIVPLNSIKEFKENRKKLFSKGSVKKEVKRITKSGELRDFILYSHQVKLSDDRTIIYTAFDDITARKEREKNIQEIKKRLEMAVEGANLGIWDWNIETGEVHYNRYWYEMLGYQKEEVGGYINFWTGLVHPADQKEIEEKLNNHLYGNCEFYESEHRLKTKDGKYKWIKDIGKVTRKDKNGNPIRAVGIHLDIDEKKRNEEKIKYLSFHDELTGLYNRRYLNNEIERLKDSRKYPLSIIVGDLDKLKIINDNYGHNVGDYCIKKSAEIIQSILRSEDIIARTGGDEFIILLPETDYETAENIADRIKVKYTQFNRRDNSVDNLSISLGVSTVESKEDNMDIHFDIADQKMYYQKANK